MKDFEMTLGYTEILKDIIRGAKKRIPGYLDFQKDSKKKFREIWKILEPAIQKNIPKDVFAWFKRKGYLRTVTDTVRIKTKFIPTHKFEGSPTYWNHYDIDIPFWFRESHCVELPNINYFRIEVSRKDYEALSKLDRERQSLDEKPTALVYSYLDNVDKAKRFSQLNEFCQQMLLEALPVLKGKDN